MLVSAGDLNGDGRDDIVTGTGPGGGPVVRVLGGTTGNQLLQFLADDAAFRGGVRVDAEDVNGDGRDDVITHVRRGNDVVVQVFDGSTGALLRQFSRTVDDNPNNGSGSGTGTGTGTGTGPAREPGPARAPERALGPALGPARGRAPARGLGPALGPELGPGREPVVGLGAGLAVAGMSDSCPTSADPASGSGPASAALGPRPMPDLRSGIVTVGTAHSSREPGMSDGPLKIDLERQKGYSGLGDIVMLAWLAEGCRRAGQPVTLPPDAEPGADGACSA